MTEQELRDLKPEGGTPEWEAQYTVEAWESRFPDALDGSGRYLLYQFILGACQRQSDEYKAKLAQAEEQIQRLSDEGVQRFVFTPKERLELEDLRAQLKRRPKRLRDD